MKNPGGIVSGLDIHQYHEKGPADQKHHRRQTMKPFGVCGADGGGRRVWDSAMRAGLREGADGALALTTLRQSHYSPPKLDSPAKGGALNTQISFDK
jgi:hypothetical protein